MPDYDRFLAALCAAAAHLGTIAAEGGGGSARVRLRTCKGREFVFDEDLAGTYRAVEGISAEGLFSGEEIPPGAAKLRLFSVHLYEALETAPPGAHRLALHSYGVVAH